MSSKRERFYAMMSLVESDEILTDGERAAIYDYVKELEQCIRESSELKAETLKLAEQRAWDAARETTEEMWFDIPSQYLKYDDFDDWKREREGK